MKKCVVTILLAFCILFPSFARRKIDMKANCDTPKRSLKKNLPIQAFIEESVKELSLEFTVELGILYVTISDTNENIIIADIINTTSHTPINIALDKTLKGKFILSIIDNNNNEIYGFFSLIK